MEKAARELDADPLEVRRRNLIGPDEFPYTGTNGITYDEGSYREALDLAERRVGEAGWYEERESLRAGGQLAGVGFACFSERTAYGTSTMGQRRMSMTPGYDVARVRMDPSGEVIVTTGTCGQGQGHETTFAQIVADRLGVHPDRVRRQFGQVGVSDGLLVRHRGVAAALDPAAQFLEHALGRVQFRAVGRQADPDHR